MSMTLLSSSSAVVALTFSLLTFCTLAGRFDAQAEHSIHAHNHDEVEVQHDAVDSLAERLNLTSKGCVEPLDRPQLNGAFKWVDQLTHPDFELVGQEKNAHGHSRGILKKGTGLFFTYGPAQTGGTNPPQAGFWYYDEKDRAVAFYWAKEECQGRVARGGCHNNGGNVPGYMVWKQLTPSFDKRTMLMSNPLDGSKALIKKVKGKWYAVLKAGTDKECYLDHIYVCSMPSTPWGGTKQFATFGWTKPGRKGSTCGADNAGRAIQSTDVHEDPDDPEDDNEPEDDPEDDKEPEDPEDDPEDDFRSWGTKDANLSPVVFSTLVLMGVWQGAL